MRDPAPKPGKSPRVRLTRDASGGLIGYDDWRVTGKVNDPSRGPEYRPDKSKPKKPFGVKEKRARELRKEAT